MAISKPFAQMTYDPEKAYDFVYNEKGPVPRRDPYRDDQLVDFLPKGYISQPIPKGWWQRFLDWWVG